MPLYNRKNPRVERYDYTIGGMYFITTCTESRENFFGKIHNKQMILSEIGKICDEELKIMLQKRPDVEMHDYIIMPNHVHLLFSTDKTLWAVVGGWKSAVSKHCHELWYHFARQPRYHDHIIRNEKEFEQIKRYIQNNPQKWEEDTFWVEI